jgi:hypothetical protein
LVDLNRGRPGKGGDYLGAKRSMVMLYFLQDHTYVHKTAQLGAEFLGSGIVERRRRKYSGLRAQEGGLAERERRDEASNESMSERSGLQG